MSRNDGYHHHKANHGRSSNKHHYDYRTNQQHAMHNRFDSYDNQQMPRFQVPPFTPIQPPPFLQQFPQMFNQQIQGVTPQIYLNRPLKHPHPSQVYSSTSNDINQNPMMQYNPQILESNISFATSQTGNWYSPTNNLSNLSPTQQPSINQAAADALSRLQLPSNQITENGIIPNTPYYELPAGLMIPLIPVSRKEYKSLNPLDLRLPLPKFPDENFLRAIDSYYAVDGKARDNDGWDREFIETYKGQKDALAETE